MNAIRNLKKDKPDKEATTDQNTTFPPEYWPVRNPANFLDREHDLREVSAALVLATKGYMAEVQDGVLYGNTAMGLEWLAETVWHMAIQIEEHGEAAGKGGAV